MLSLVLDASVTISALIEEDRSDEVRDIFETIAKDGAMVPALWPLEVGHILLRAERRRLLEAADRRPHLRHLSRLPIAVDHEMAGHAWPTLTGHVRWGSAAGCQRCRSDPVVTECLHGL
jgi:predicted nucleic acid-binding protein